MDFQQRLCVQQVVHISVIECERKGWPLETGVHLREQPVQRHNIADARQDIELLREVLGRNGERPGIAVHVRNPMIKKRITPRRA